MNASRFRFLLIPTVLSVIPVSADALVCADGSIPVPNCTVDINEDPRGYPVAGYTPYLVSSTCDFLASVELILDNGKTGYVSVPPGSTARYVSPSGKVLEYSVACLD